MENRWREQGGDGKWRKYIYHNHILFTINLFFQFLLFLHGSNLLDLFWTHPLPTIRNHPIYMSCVYYIYMCIILIQYTVESL